MTTVEERDRDAARALATAGLLLVAGWVAVGLLAGSVRLVDELARHRAVAHAGEWSGLLPLPVTLALSLLWTAAFPAVGLGVAFAVAALAVDGRLGRAAAFFALVALCASAQYVLEALRSTATGDLHPDRGATVIAAVGSLVAPLAGLVVAVVLLGPVLRTPRSTPAPAAAG